MAADAASNIDDRKAMEVYLQRCHVLIKHFKSFAQQWTDQIKAKAYQAAEKAKRPLQYLSRPDVSKEDLARQIARRDGIESGLIAIFSAVEPCLSYSVRGDRLSKEIHLVLETRKCTHLYPYYQHRDFGLCHVRVQTWFPFTVDVCLNGREWLARQMDRAGLSYQQQDNCFVRLSEPARAHRHRSTHCRRLIFERRGAGDAGQGRQVALVGGALKDAAESAGERV